MKHIKINKSPLKNDFLQINRETVGAAMGVLTKPTAIKMYIYLIQHQDGKLWTMNTVAFANWLGLDYSNESAARKARRLISEGMQELIDCGFMREVGKEQYEFSDTIYPENKEAKTDKICPEIIEVKTDKKCPKDMGFNKTDTICPENQNNKTDTNCPKNIVSYGDFVF